MTAQPYTGFLSTAEIADGLLVLTSRLKIAERNRLELLLSLLSTKQSVALGEVLESLFPDSPTDMARQRSLLRFVEKVNESAQVSNLDFRLSIEGAKQLGDERKIGFLIPEIIDTTGQADLAESIDLQPIPLRQGKDVTSSKPTAKVTLWSTRDDMGKVKILWSELSKALKISRNFYFLVRDSNADLLAGDNPIEHSKADIEWADYVIVAVTKKLLGDLSTMQEREVLKKAVDEKRCIPILFSSLPRTADLNIFKALFASKGTWIPSDNDKTNKAFSSLHSKE